MRCQAADFAAEKLQAEIRDLVLERNWVILHHLHCPRCGRQAEAWALLTLAHWTESDLMDRLSERHG